MTTAAPAPPSAPPTLTTAEAFARLREMAPAFRQAEQAAGGPLSPFADGSDADDAEALAALQKALGETQPAPAPVVPTDPPAPPTATTAGQGDGGHDGRDHRGRFQKGNPGGPGNPNARRSAALRRALADTATPARMRQLGDRLFEQALAGDLSAAKLWLAYVVGRPAEAIDADRLDLDEWALLQAQPSRAEALRAVLETVPAPIAAALLQQLLAGQADPIQLAKDLTAAAKTSPALLEEVKAEQAQRTGRKPK